MMQTELVWLLGPLVGLLLMMIGIGFLIFVKKRALNIAIAVIVVFCGISTIAGTFVTYWYVTNHVDLGPREKLVEGKRHVTLTGWDKKDYSFLTTKPDIVVLQMANADVNDGTLEFLRSMKELEELDLNDSGITDEGLKTLAALPALKILRIARTQVTESGFRESLLPKETLTNLDLTGLKLTGKTKREWKKLGKDRSFVD
jgi:Leucine-rich repeat (LRR) protein